MINKFGRTSFVLAVLWGAAALVQSAPARAARLCAVSQSWAAEDRNLGHVLAILDQAAAQQAEIVCLPEDCVPTDGGAAAQAALEAIAAQAAERKLYVAANLKEQDGDRIYSTSYLLGPDGRLIGKYRKSHRLPDEAIKPSGVHGSTAGTRLRDQSFRDHRGRHRRPGRRGRREPGSGPHQRHLSPDVPGRPPAV
jgi:predicted amidohydrolase